MQWIAPRWGREPLSKITSVQLQKWFDEMAVGSSRKGDIARIVRGVFEKAVQIKILSKAPSFKIVADPENPRPHFTDEEVRQVLDRLPGWCEGKNWRRATLLNFVVQVLLGTGLRPGNETTMLRWTDFQIWSVKDGKPRYKLRVARRPIRRHAAARSCSTAIWATSST
jgi:integrase